MALQDRPVRLTYTDYLLFPEDGRRHEILDGEHYVTAAPFLRHQALVVELAAALHPFIRSNKLGRLFVAPADVVFISTERLHILTERNIQGAPDLVIEILSESTRRTDGGIKLATYERFGVRECWLADPGRKTVLVYRLEEGRLRKIAELSAADGDVLTTPLLPGLEIRLA